MEFSLQSQETTEQHESHKTALGVKEVTPVPCKQFIGTGVKHQQFVTDSVILQQGACTIVWHSVTVFILAAILCLVLGREHTNLM